MNQRSPGSVGKFFVATLIGGAMAVVAPAQGAPAQADARQSADSSTLAVAHPASTIPFKKIKLTGTFFCEGANIGDFNHDGKMDVVSGPYWYEGPNFAPEKRHQIYPPKAFDPHDYSDNFFTFVYDFDGDGWDDVLVYGFPGAEARWYQNPRSKPGDWPVHKILDAVDNESPWFIDINGDGKPDIVTSNGGYLGYATADWKSPSAPWTFHKISPKGEWQRFTHGMGVGDVNGDGRMDLLVHNGWYEQPASLEGDPPWKYHQADFGPGGAQMHVYDVNGDGRPDVITSLEAHGYGLAWFEQKSDGSFEKHLIQGAKITDNPQHVRFSQMHAVDLIDIDGDGLKDIVTGKRYWAHGPGADEEPGAPAVLYWFKLVREADGQVQWIANEIDNDSGVGTQVVTGDVNGDKKPDIVVGNKKGTFVFIQQAK